MTTLNWAVNYLLADLGAHLTQKQGLILNFEFQATHIGSTLRVHPESSREITIQFRALGLMTAKAANDKQRYHENYELTDAGLRFVLPAQAIKRS